MKMSSCVFSAIRAFSTNWPYFACAGFQNYLILINCFDSKFIQKIQLANESQNITICDSFMSDTYDLFVLIQQDGEYKLHMVDLDAANVNEFDGDDLNDEELTTYKIGEPIYQYNQDDVEGRQFLKLYARGSSRKEEFDRNEKLIVYFLHEGKIFSWTSLTKYSRYD